MCDLIWFDELYLVSCSAYIFVWYPRVQERKWKVQVSITVVAMYYYIKAMYEYIVLVMIMEDCIPKFQTPNQYIKLNKNGMI